jgi:uncharacterized protein (DUF1499 family)
MRILTILVALVLFAFIAGAVWFRMAPMPPETWHVDPASATPPVTPNYVLRTGADAPRLAGTPTEVMLRLDAVAKSEGAERIWGDPSEGFVTYVVRSRLMGFPDAISIRLHEDGDQTRVDIFSRSRFGQSDMGVNAARVARWIDAASS